MPRRLLHCLRVGATAPHLIPDPPTLPAMAPRALLGDGPEYDNPDSPAVPDGAEALAECLARMTAAQRGAMGFQAAASTWLALFKGGCLEPGATCHHYAVPPAQRPYEWGE